MDWFLVVRTWANERDPGLEVRLFESGINLISFSNPCPGTLTYLCSGTELAERGYNLAKFWPEGNCAYMIESRELAANGDGIAFVSCDERGGRLRPFKTCWKGGSWQARFLIEPEAAYVSVAANANGHVQLVRRQLQLDGLQVTATEELVYQGWADGLPDEAAHFRNAMQAAVGKANCNRCQRCHYTAR